MRLWFVCRHPNQGTTQEKLYALAELAFLDAQTLLDDDQLTEH